jgi:4'-phosphopantetheinyl transferase
MNLSSSIYWNLIHRSQIPQDHPMGFLSKSESIKLSGLHFPKRRADWLLGRWAAKALVYSLPAYRQYSLDEIEIKNTPEGAPYIQPVGGGVARECLSISHSDPFALAALSPDPRLRIGVDLERIEPRSDIFLEDYFTRTELELMFSFPAAQRALLANLFWSIKEAMLKAVGVGLRRDTRSVEVYQMDGLFSKDGSWHRLRVREAECPHRNWAACVQQRGEFVIALAGFTTMQADFPIFQLVEIN